MSFTLTPRHNDETAPKPRVLIKVGPLVVAMSSKELIFSGSRSGFVSVEPERVTLLRAVRDTIVIRLGTDKIVVATTEAKQIERVVTAQLESLRIG